MNRSHSRNIRLIRPNDLPPAAAAGPARILFINSNILGMKTQASLLRDAASGHPGVDAVHIDIERPFWVKLLTGSYRMPAGVDLPYYRYLQVYRRIIGHWLRGPLDVRRFDVVHFLTQSVAGCLLDLAFQLPAAIVLNIDSTAQADCEEFGASFLTHAPYIRAERLMFGRADLIACYSRWAAHSAQEHYGQPPTKLRVVPNGVLVPPLPSGPRHSGLPRIVFIGNDWKRKGGDDLLRIHQQLFAETAELHIVSSASRPSGPLKNVVWHGCVDRHVLTTELLPTMDVFVLPTRMDMAPWVVLEAAAAGLPVIATRLAAIPEMVIDGETGMLSSMGDLDAFARAIDTLLRNPEMRLRMGQRGREHVRANYNQAVVYRKYLDELVALGLAQRRTREISP